MRRQPHPGTTTYDYYAHISMLERTPSVYGDTDAHRYPNLHPLFDGKNAAAHHEVEKHPQFQEKVEVIEFHEGKSDDRGRNEELELVEEGAVDLTASSYIEQKHKGFELCKWKTFKAL